MSEKTAKVLLASVILARSSSYVLQKIGLTNIDMFNLMSIRFLLSFIIMLFIFNKKLRYAQKSSVISGLIVGSIYFVVMSFEVFSLKTCESSTTAFLENTAIVIVPLFESFLRKKTASAQNNRWLYNGDGGRCTDDAAGSIYLFLCWAYSGDRCCRYLCRGNHHY